jgi:hypothetical protein
MSNVSIKVVATSTELNGTVQNQWHTQALFSGGGSTDSIEDRGQIELVSGGGSLLVRGSTQFANG